MSKIEWTSWGEEAFARAAREDRPILLSISAVWCHWCHVMDDTTYSDPTIIEAEVNPLIVQAQGEGVVAVDALVLRGEQQTNR